MRRSLLIGLLLLGACSSPKPPAGEDLAAPRGDLGVRDLSVAQDLFRPVDFTPPPDLFAPPDFGPDYPPGPYGNMIGDTLAPMIWEGYVNPTAVGLASAKAYQTYTSDDLRRSGKRYALLYAADYF